MLTMEEVENIVSFELHNSIVLVGEYLFFIVLSLAQNKDI